MAGRVKIGVAAWGDLNAYYPRGMKPAERLTFYAAEFPLVEVDTSYYAIPAPRMPASWGRLPAACSSAMCTFGMPARPRTC